MFTPEERARLRADLLQYASADDRISGAAITGSAAAGREDRWSDIDLAFGVDDPARVADVLSDWTARMYKHHLAVHHLDVLAGAWIYRVFLLPGTLQVDLAFVPATEFRPLAPTFRLVSGKANDALPVATSNPEVLIGFAWLYALHARTCIARRQFWQAEYMISGMRDHALALACLRHGLPAVHGRGMDLLPPAVISQFEGALVRKLDSTELSRAFRVTMNGLIGEIRNVDEPLAGRLEEPLAMLIESPR
jgi:hypothetical protein